MAQAVCLLTDYCKILHVIPGHRYEWLPEKEVCFPDYRQSI